MIDLEDVEYMAWMWRHGTLGVETFETLEDAVSYAEGEEDYGVGALSHIERIGQGVVPDAEVRAIQDRIEREREVELAATPRAEHVAWLRSDHRATGRDWASLGGFSGPEPGWLVEARGRFGERVRVTKAGTYPH